MDRFSKSPSGFSRMSEIYYERKGMEEILTVPKALVQEFAHEIRNPLSMIKGTVQLIKLKQKEINPKYLESVLAEVERINRTLEEFVTLAKSEKAFCEFNLNQMLAEVVKFLSSDSELGDVDLRLDCGPEVLWVEGNVEQFKQLLLYLARNGMEAMDGFGTLTFELKLLPENRAQIAISDTGTGVIDPEILDQVFEPHDAAKLGTTELSLTVCQRIVEKHQGEIFVENNQKDGCTFYITLPVIRQTHMDDVING